MFWYKLRVSIDLSQCWQSHWAIGDWGHKFKVKLSALVSGHLWLLCAEDEGKDPLRSFVDVARRDLSPTQLTLESQTSHVVPISRVGWRVPWGSSTCQMGRYPNDGVGGAFSTQMKLFHLGFQEWAPAEAGDYDYTRDTMTKTMNDSIVCRMPYAVWPDSYVMSHMTHNSIIYVEATCCDKVKCWLVHLKFEVIAQVPKPMSLSWACLPLACFQWLCLWARGCGASRCQFFIQTPTSVMCVHPFRATIIL